MYSGNAARIYNPQPDPLERGPPKRVVREEQHIGEIVAASKKRVSWRFTLGESDRTHEMVLMHSIMSYKKLVQYDGCQIHFSSTATLGDWSFSMILDGLNVVMEVRINEMESADVPKYDFIIDKVPFRRWDVFRRKKYANTSATYAQPNALPGNAYGTHRWGPGGATPSSQNESQLHRSSFAGCPEPVSGSTRGSFTGNYPMTDCTQSFGLQDARSGASSGQSNGRTPSFSGQQNEQQVSSSVQQYGGKRSSLQEQSAPLALNPGVLNVQRQPPPVTTVPKPKKQPEINLIDDFGPTVSVSAQSLIFDPLTKILPTGDSAATSALQQQQQQPQQPQQQPQQQHQHQAPSMSAVFQPATYVDPFASVATPVVAKPVERIKLDPFANPNASNYQQHQQQPTRQISASTTNQATRYQQSMLGMPMGASMGGMALQQQSGLPGMGNVNYNISQLMNPASLQNGQNQQGKSINIDAFAGLD